ncbi:CHAT domain-containing protein [Leptolyngbya cf. ectocarpi LEGE 11479]|uniref:CHAT domain-containing protein n=1 Tax=Leptolyngbya cf. ectocarpi LEGE 11479 TaxID=1828722 RepID=A0A928ZUY7_LEPEC|nr:CHAT domain-containing protein [Leptolyngbya ectocarpi]MBE9067933.1 CHAT domain-containing protein [Leptolyngbya cf. ectocarpi LEGE 11479]
MKRVIHHLVRYGILFCLGIVLSMGVMPVLVHTHASAQSVLSRPQSAESLIEQGRILYEQGKWEDALENWQDATRLYRELNDPAGITGSLLNQAKAFARGGHYRQACRTALVAIGSAEQHCDFSEPAAMTAAMAVINTEADPTIKLLKWVTLGNILRLNGYLPQAQDSLEAAVTLVQGLSQPELQAKTLLSLGKVQQLRYQQAVQRYQQTQDLADQDQAIGMAFQAFDTYQRVEPLLDSQASNTLLQAQFAAQMLDLLTQMSPGTLLSHPSQRGALSKLTRELQYQVQRLKQLPLATVPPSRELTDSQLSLAQSLIRLWMLPEGTIPPSPTADILPLLNQAYGNAIALQDITAQSQTLGILGHLYEIWNNQSLDRWHSATQATQKALALAQSVQASHLVYQWSWQLGRLYQQENHRDVGSAIAYYQTAVDTLGDVRQNLLALNPDVRFSLRDNSEPLYREFILLLLESADGASPSQKNLQQAVREVDALQLAQLEDFLSCNLTQQVALDKEQLDPTAAIFYPIILPNQLAVVVRFPKSEELRFYRTQLPDTDISQFLESLRREVERPFLTQTFFNQSQQVYDWLIRPIESELADQVIDTLVFVSDGALRNVPMSILHDGQQFLIEKYAIALSPSLTLPTSQPLSASRLAALTFGLSETRPNFPPHQGFAPLENVETELTIIQDQLPSQQRLNQSFTSGSLKTLVGDESAPVVHLATHGQFSSNPHDTFLLAWDRRLTLNDLSQLLNSRTEQTAIELLVLSACQTATGDSHATLGLAGVAIQSGARSTIASLWSVDDIATTELMGYLYQALSTTAPTRAQALRQAQLALLNNPSFRAPIYWSAFVLVGNWQ